MNCFRIAILISIHSKQSFTGSLFIIRSSSVVAYYMHTNIKNGKVLKVKYT